MRYESDDCGNPEVIVPENDLDRQVLGDLLGRLLRAQTEAGIKVHPRWSHDGPRWSLDLADKAIEHLGSGWWLARARAGTLGKEERLLTVAEALETTRCCDYEVALGYYPNGTPRLMYRRPGESTGASTYPFFAEQDCGTWR